MVAMSFGHFVAVLLAGCAAGTINTIVGSGSLITFPTLLALGYPPLVANVSNNIGLVPGALSGVYGYRRELDRLAPGALGVSKVSVQTGTSHGGIPLPGGGVAKVKLDFEVLRELGEVGRREYGIAGAVQHGASTLPDELFHHFPAVETAEIHLATGFQNALYEHPAFPADLHKEIWDWCFANCADERGKDQTDEQFVYTTRKKAIGPFKRQLWDLATRDEILATQKAKIAYLFEALQVVGSRAMVERYVKPVAVRRPVPEVVAQAAK